MVNITWTLPADLYQPFIDFYRTTTQQGIIPFYFKHPETEIVNAYRFVQAPEINFIPGKKGVAAFEITSVWELQE
jgi:hypothetical protein